MLGIDGAINQLAADMASSQREAVMKNGLKMQNLKGHQATKAMAQYHRGFSTSLNAFDANPLQLNTPSGIVDLTTGLLLPADPKAMHSKSTAVPYDPSAPPPERWLSFLDEVLPTPELRAFVQRWFGYCATGLTHEQKFVVMLGAGANGKSVLADTVAYGLGEYAHATPMDTFVAKRGNGGATPEIMAMQGARLTTANEGNAGQKLDTSRVKNVTGDAEITARPLFGGFVTFPLTTKLMLLSNNMPEIPADDAALYRRLIILPFNRVFQPNERDAQLPRKLRDEAGGILKWMVEGAREYLRIGLAIPDELTQVVEAARAEGDIIGAFIAERCTVGNQLSVSSTVLYREFERYAREFGADMPTQTSFSLALTRRGYASRKTGGLMYRHGIALAPLWGGRVA
jgi:putative DNA primase/helicase